MATENGTGRGSDKPSSTPEKSSPSLVVERITHSDVPAVCALLKRVWESGPSGLPPEIAKSWTPTPLEFTSRMEGITFFAARRESRLVGLIGGELVHGSCRVLQLVVEPDSRRQGVASALVGATVDWARRANASSTWVEVLARFGPASALFRRLGFTLGGSLHRHEWNEDVELFEKVF